MASGQFWTTETDYETWFILSAFPSMQKQYINIQRKFAKKKNASENVVWRKYLPNITEELSKEANSVDPEQTAPI